VAACLAPGGAAVFEFPYLGEMLERTAFDTVYHEHVFYFSLAAVAGLGARAGLEVFDVERYPVHGGSLRVFFQHRGARPIAPAVARLHAEESAVRADLPRAVRLVSVAGHALHDGADGPAARAARRRPAARGLRRARQGHGAAERLRHRHEPARVHGGSQPAQAGPPGAGRRLPIRPPEDLVREMPDVTLLLPWNLAEEIVAQQSEYVAKGGTFLVPGLPPRLVGAGARL
jgi:hypothetical protein